MKPEAGFIHCGDCGDLMQWDYARSRYKCEQCDKKEFLNGIKSGNGKPDKYSPKYQEK